MPPARSLFRKGNVMTHPGTPFCLPAPGPPQQCNEEDGRAALEFAHDYLVNTTRDRLRRRMAKDKSLTQEKIEEMLATVKVGWDVTAHARSGG